MSAATAVWFAAGTGAVSAFIAYWYAVGKTERMWRARLRNAEETFVFLMRRYTGALSPAERASFDAIVDNFEESA